jgi:hypothetical protein
LHQVENITVTQLCGDIRFNQFLIINQPGCMGQQMMDADLTPECRRALKKGCYRRIERECAMRCQPQDSNAAVNCFVNDARRKLVAMVTAALRSRSAIPSERA